MRAVQYTAFGAPMTTVTLPVPSPAKNEVLVKTAAAAINPIDFKLRDGMLPRPIARVPCVPGADFAGTVVAVGSDVTAFKPNDAVYGTISATAALGTLAEYVACPVTGLVHRPASLSTTDAASLPLAGLTALQALDAARVKSGDTVLITAAAGGVGSLAVQLAVARGAHVVGTAGSKNQEFVKGLGATPLDYTEGPLAANAPPGVIPEGGFDAVVDVMGGAVEDDAYALTAAKGAFQSILNSGTSAPKIVKGKARALLGGGPKYGVTVLSVARACDGLKKFNDLVAAGKLRAIVAGPLRKLDDAEAAFTDLKAGHTRGKIVFEI